ncbi:uncharacterized protein LOC114747610 [Neltuma alba]|uniref:uncharacterized protein LOC114747610 n=1 Tax=Neltuma alba TaxID=207710 RepID=UPI0010A4F95A|nr:uncharacterized protein LOC114747610 [Prosopis alba]
MNSNDFPPLFGTLRWNQATSGFNPIALMTGSSEPNTSGLQVSSPSAATQQSGSSTMVPEFTAATQQSGSSTMAPEFTAATENQQMVIAHKLNGSNYLQWSQSVLMYLRGRCKEKYVNGQAPQPLPDDASFDTWFAENNQVMTWLCNSMTLEISEGHLLAWTAKEMWDAAKRTYSSIDNTAALYQLKKQLRELKQESNIGEDDWQGQGVGWTILLQYE